MSRHQTSSRSTIESTQPPQDISARQTLMLFSSLKPLLQGAITLKGGKCKGTSDTHNSGARIGPPE